MDQLTFEERLKLSAERCLQWVEENMLTFDRGTWGVYERIRTDRNERVCYCRPDVAAEYLRVLDLYAKSGKTTYNDIFKKVSAWLLYAQNTEKEAGAFPFYLVDGNKELPASKLIYQNDNGKVLIHLLYLYEKSKDESLLAASRQCGSYWLSRQRRRGNYYGREQHLKKKYSFGPCFLLWLATGMIMLGKVTGDDKFLSSGYRAITLAYSYIEGGRMKTSYEICRTEDWRPVSSENFIALYCFGLCYKATGDKTFLERAKEIEEFCFSLIEKNGAVRNGDERTEGSSLNNARSICDFVYTQGYALCALVTLYEGTKDEKYLEAAKRLAQFAMQTQCAESDKRTDGGWRGSYSTETGKAEGRCNQNNSLDEGGKYSLYTGWCAFPITQGLLILAKILSDKKEEV